MNLQRPAQPQKKAKSAQKLKNVPMVRHVEQMTQEKKFALHPRKTKKNV